MKEIKIGVVGCGNISNAHIGSYQKIPGVDLAAFCDSDEERAKKLAGKFNGSYYSDYCGMLDRENLDGISICTPPALHRDMAVAALKRGINVLCEKPLARNVKESRDIAAAQDKSTAFLMVAFKFRFNYFVNEVKKLLENGALGKIVFFRNMFGGFADMAKHVWFGKKEPAGGGVLMDNGSHSIDLFRYLFGEMKGIYANIANIAQEMEVEDTARLVVETEAGILGTSYLSWSVPVPCEFHLEIYGTQGSLFMNLFTNQIGIRYRVGQGEWKEVDGSQEKGMFEREVEHFVNCIRDEEDLLVDARDGLRAQEIIEAGYLSAREGRYIELPRRK